MRPELVFFFILLWLLNINYARSEQQPDISEKDFSLLWIDKHSLLISGLETDRNWHYSFKTQKLTTLPKRFTHATALASPSGKLLFSGNWSLKNELHLLNLQDTDFIQHMQTFVIPEMSVEDPDEEKGGHIMQSFWVSNSLIYIEYFNIRSGRYQCHIFNTFTRQIESVKACFNFLQYPGETSLVNYLGNDFYSIYSSAEGEVSVRITKWTRDKGNHEVKFPELWIGMGSSIRLFYEKQDASFYALSPVPLKSDAIRAVTGKDDSAKDPLLYRWSADKGFLNVPFKLSNRAVLQSVSGKVTAWISINADQICTYKPLQQLICHNIQLNNP